MDQKVAFRHLTKRIAIDNQPLSYRVVSRELGITIQEAKILLSDFHKEPSSRDRKITATYCLTGTLKLEEDDTKMQVDDEAEQGGSNHEGVLPKKVIMLVQESEIQAATSRFSPEPQSHIYALHQSPLASTSDLSLHTLSLLSTSAHRGKWKNEPIGGYGEIVHPHGERKKSSGKAKSKATTTASKPSTSSMITKRKEDPTKSSTSNQKDTKPVVSNAPRKIGELGGLFARSSAAPPKATKPTVPTKRKSTSPVKTAKKNGLFEDEELASDEDDDAWDEEALRQAEESALAGPSAKAGAAATATGEKKKVAAAPPPPPPSKKTNTATNGAGNNTKPVQQKGIGSFFGKK